MPVPRCTNGRANGRLLAATPLRSATAKLTMSELITESGLRRFIVYGHPRPDATPRRCRERWAAMPGPDESGIRPGDVHQLSPSVSA